MTERAPWRHPRIIYTLLAVFLAGAAAGALVTKLTATHVRGIRAASDPTWREGSKEISLQKFKKELDLTPEQTVEMERILDDFVMYYQTLQAQMDDVRSVGKHRILKILREEQKQKFGKMIEELQSKQLR